ncbi:YqhG family protein [Paenibacillus sp. JX-17]|uniref:YqhG family protein n=1 Tax=Paenibacillus lacisoli TaxID=3064525 RepID=A0ABT9C9N7_9BACL|nr:YqhG family protein [Paenibacillus sp. JX-17]MDO7905973.1 YqhG family protein [Paenibacillus sp. JX-17]
MPMNKETIQHYVTTYLEATECAIIERSPAHVTVKLSPAADKALTNRPYYWGFVERTGAPPETMSFTFVFDPEAYSRQGEQPPPAPPLLPADSRNTPAPAGGTLPAGSSTAPAGPQDGLLARYFGTAPALPVLGPGRVLSENMTYGSRRLQAIFEAAKEGGSYVQLFQQPLEEQRSSRRPAAYEPWLGVCFKVEFACDMKKEEMYFPGISLVTGQIVEHFDEVLAGRDLTPRLPENIHTKPARLGISAAAQGLHTYVTGKLQPLDYSWSVQAQERLEEELAVVDHYYDDLLKEQPEDKKEAVQQQHETRRSEMRWQYEPKVIVSAINCGIFHLQ